MGYRDGNRGETRLLSVQPSGNGTGSTRPLQKSEYRGSPPSRWKAVGAHCRATAECLPWRATGEHGVNPTLVTPIRKKASLPGYRKGPRSDAGTKEDHHWLRPALSHHCGNLLVGMGYAVGSSSQSAVRSAPSAGARRKRSCKTTSSAGYPTARGTNKAVASGLVAQRARETLICERCWEKWPGSSPA